MTSLTSFADGMHVVVVGAGGGIGGAFVEALATHGRVASLHATSRRGQPARAGKLRWLTLDTDDEGSIADAAERIGERVPGLDLVINATGLLHDDDAGLAPEKTWRHLAADSLERSFRANAIGPALVAKHFLPRLRSDRKAAFAALSARVGSIEDNGLGGWYGYRASKAALNMLLRSLAIELGRRNPAALCVGLHPGTVDSRLSQPFQANMPAGKLFSPDRAAGHLLDVLDGLGPEDSGHLFAWDGHRIPF